LSGLERVLQQRSDGHGTDAARHRGDEGALVLHIGEVHVASEAEAGRAGVIAQAGDAHVHDDCALLDHVGGHEVGLADGHDQDVGTAADLRHVRRAAVYEGHGAVAGIAVAGHQHCHWRANDVAAANHHTVLAHGVDVIALQQFHDAVGGGGDKGGQSQAHLADVGRVETVDVLARVDGQRQLDLIDVLRQGHRHDDRRYHVDVLDLVHRHRDLDLIDVVRLVRLHDAAIYVVVTFQLVDLRQLRLDADISGMTHQRGFETDALAGKHLLIHVDPAG